MAKVKDLMTKKVLAVPASTAIQQICKILFQNSLSGLPVVDDKHKLVGFVSESDIIATIAKGAFSDKKAKDIMCRNITTVKEEATLSEVSKIFSKRPFRHLPVMRKTEIVGIISRKDVIGKLLSS